MTIKRGFPTWIHERWDCCIAHISPCRGLFFFCMQGSRANDEPCLLLTESHTVHLAYCDVLYWVQSDSLVRLQLVLSNLFLFVRKYWQGLQRRQVRSESNCCVSSDYIPALYLRMAWYWWLIQDKFICTFEICNTEYEYTCSDDGREIISKRQPT